MKSSHKATVREMRRSDVDEMASWPKYSEPQFQWANLNLPTHLERDIWFTSAQTYNSRRFAILDEQDHLVGVIGLRGINKARGEATLGIRLSPGDVNRGYGTQGIIAVLDYAFSHMGLRRINLDVADDNHRARRCYDKCGFVYVKQRINYDGIVYTDMTITKEKFYKDQRARLQASAPESTHEQQA